ncbi:MAG: hypothetical protein ACLUIQ_11615 [Dialister invisus]
MIRELHVLRYLDRALYEAVCSRRLGWMQKERSIRITRLFALKSPVRAFHAYHIDYAAFSPIDFLIA